MRRGRTWWIQFREDGRRVRESLATTSRKVAGELCLRRAIEHGQRKLGIHVPAVAVMTAAPTATAPNELATPTGSVDDIRAEYAAWSLAHKRARTIRNDTARLAAFFATVPGLSLREIRTPQIERYFTPLAKKGRSPATLMRNREILHAFWKWAIRQGYTEHNIVAPIPRPRLPERDPVFLSLEQIDGLLRAVSGTAIEGAIATAVFAGLRREELCWLTWDDFDLDRTPAMLRVRSKCVQGESWQPKTRRDRKVPVSPRLLEVLRRLERKPGAVWLFVSPRGCRWDPHNLSRELRGVMERAGLPWNLLQLRHTFGSQLAKKGVSLLKIAKLMGNSPAIAARHYINLVPEEMADEVAF